MIQQELAAVIMRDLDDPRLPPSRMPSITHVKVSPDLSAADVYVTVMGTEGQQTAALHALRHSAGLMRSKLAKVLQLRTSPYIKFHIDENLKKEIAVLDLLHKVAEENAELDRQRAAAASGGAEGGAEGGGGNGPSDGEQQNQSGSGSGDNTGAPPPQPA